MLQTLLKTSGVNQNFLKIVIDGLFEEPVRAARLEGTRSVQHFASDRPANASNNQRY
jgi:hypothetical protein